jgi:hypothetical protein
LRLLHQIGRNTLHERSGDVRLHQVVGDEWRLGAGSLRQGFPRGRLDTPGRSELMRLLECLQCALEVGSAPSVDLAGRKSDAIEHDLRRERFAHHRRRTIRRPSCRGRRNRARQRHQHQENFCPHHMTDVAKSGPGRGAGGTR